MDKLILASPYLQTATSGVSGPTLTVGPWATYRTETSGTYTQWGFNNWGTDYSETNPLVSPIPTGGVTIQNGRDFYLQSSGADGKSGQYAGTYDPTQGEIRARWLK